MNFKEEFMRGVINDPIAQSYPIEMHLAGRVGKRWHAEHQCDYGRDSNPQARFRYCPQDILLSEIGDKDICPQCFQLPDTTLGTTLTSVVEIELIQGFLGENQERAYSQLEWWQTSLEYLLDDIEHTLELSENKPLLSRMEAILAASDDMEKRLRELYKSPSGQESLRTWVLNATHHQKADTALRLIGFSKLGLPPQRWESGLFQSFIIASDAKKAVLSAPRYVEYAIRDTWEARLRAKPGLISSTSDPIDSQLRETAAKLWDPDGDGPLSSMEGALKTALAL